VRLGIAGLLCAGLVSVFGCKQVAGGLARVCAPGATQVCQGPGRCGGSQSCLPSGKGYSACDCGSVPDAGALGPLCTPGELRVCSGEGGCGGVQECSADGLFAACDCSGHRLAVSTLAAPCAADTECGADLQCWSVNTAGIAAFVGGAPHGYCTRACRLTTDCSDVDPSAVCSGPGAEGTGICLRGCLSKEPLPGEAKCLNRVDQMCLSTAALGREPFSTTERQPGVCVPSCGSDEDCAPRLCDLVSGLCLDRVAAGAAIGAACTADAECAGGLCVEPLAGSRFCSAGCALDSLGCGFGSDANPREAACLLPWISQGGVSEGRQDLGICLQLCNSDPDCTQPSWVCDTASGGLPGAAGACVPADSTAGNPTPDAGADAAGP